MRTTAWSLAFLASASPALAVPGFGNFVNFGYGGGNAVNPWANNPWAAPASGGNNAYSHAPVVSKNGRCGGPKKHTCLGSAFGNCCGKDGHCGNDAKACGAGCKSKFGSCGLSYTKSSTSTSKASAKTSSASLSKAPSASAVSTSAKSASSPVSPVSLSGSSSKSGPSVYSSVHSLSASKPTVSTSGSLSKSIPALSSASASKSVAPASSSAAVSASSTLVAPVSGSHIISQYSTSALASSAGSVSGAASTSHITLTSTITRKTTVVSGSVTSISTHTSILTTTSQVALTSSVPAWSFSYSPVASGSSSSPVGPVSASSASYSSSSPPFPISSTAPSSSPSGTGVKPSKSASGTGSVGTAPASSSLVGMGSSSSPVGPISTGSSSSAAAPVSSSSAASLSASASASLSASASVTAPASVITTPITTGSETLFTTFTTVCNGTTETVSAPITSKASSTTVGPVSNGASSTPSISVNSTSAGPTTSAAPSQSITISVNSTAGGPTGTSISKPVSSAPAHSVPTTLITGSETLYTTFVTTCNGTVETVSAPITGYSTPLSSKPASISASSTSAIVVPVSGSSSSIPHASGSLSLSANATLTSSVAASSASASFTHSGSSASANVTTTYASGSVSGSLPPHSVPVTSSASSTAVKPISTSSKPAPTSSSSVVAANSTSAGASKSPSSSASSSSTSSCVKPTSTAACVPCAGSGWTGSAADGPANFCGYTAKTNSYLTTPVTCNTVTYDLTITDTTCAPDGVSRPCMLVNGQMPGPLIEATWGDTIVINLHNKMTTNGTSLHFHGLRQYGSNEYDGVPSITQCPLAPGSSMQYSFTAQDYGYSWYHSHSSVQTYDGVFGPVKIHGPNSAPAGTTVYGDEYITLQDWSHATSLSIFKSSEIVTGGRAGQPTLDNGLINGLNVWNAGGSGKRFELNVVAGKTYRLRVVNTAIQSTFKFYIDGHSFTVISNDFVPIVPYTTKILNINTGQRYEVLVTFDQPVGNYWMRSDIQAACSTVTQGKDIKAIVRYSGAPAGNPTSTAYTYNDECIDEPLASLVPYVALDAGALSQSVSETVTIQPNGGTPNVYRWYLSGTTFVSNWADPTLRDIVNNGTVPTYSGPLAIEAPKLGEWVYIIIDSPVPVPHPIHLHGHDFFILAQGPGLYSTSVALNLKNPPRRDSALLPWAPAGPAGPPTGGHLVVAFFTDNPGVWLMHCHIGWHATMGFALQIIENLSGIKKNVGNTCVIEDVCKSWATFAAIGQNGVQLDAGI